MLKKINDINQLPEQYKEYILYTIKGLLKDAKIRLLYPMKV